MVRRLVLGCGDVGERVVDRLGDEPASLLVITAADGVVTRLRDGGVPARLGDPTDPDTLTDIEPPETVIVAGDRTAHNVTATSLARDRFPDARVLAYAGPTPTQEELDQLVATADDVLESTRAIADRVLERAASPEAERARHLRSALSSIEGPLAVVTHDNPDPDAIASAIALTDLAETVGLSADACYYGEISHQENRAMVNVLDLELTRFESTADVAEYGGIALVDHSRPGINDGLPTDLAVDIVVDHHPPRGPVAGSFVDIRTLAGATSTIFAEYVERFGAGFDRATATALLYGIRVDTNDFVRETSALDFRAAATLRPHVNQSLLDRIEQPTIDGETFDTIARAIKSRARYDDVVVASCGRVASRDALPQAADRLLSMDGVRTTLVYGFIEEMVYLSARSRDRELDVGEVIRDAFEPIGSAGGHSDMAGAQLEIGVLGSVDPDGEADADGPDHTEAILAAVEDVVENRFIEAIEGLPGPPAGSYTRESELLFDPGRSGVGADDEPSL